MQGLQSTLKTSSRYTGGALLGVLAAVGSAVRVASTGVTTIIGIAVVGRAILAALRRVKPVSSAGGQAEKASSTQARDRLQLSV